jgi:hypothetical protein
MVVKKFDAADKTNLTTIETGVYYPNLGKSNQEIAALSRSSHHRFWKGNRGEESEYLELINGEKLKNNHFLKELTPVGIVFRWKTV